jgi:hypothetical protein
MSRKQKPFNEGLNKGLSKFSQQVTADPSASEQVEALASPARWFFLQHSAPPSTLYPAYLDAASRPWLEVFAGYWSSLATRHRAIQLAASIQGQEFVRWLAHADLSMQIGSDVEAFLSPEPWFAPLNSSSTYVEVAIRYCDSLTTVGDLNAHVISREAQCFIPTDEGAVSSPEVARVKFPVTIDVIGEFQVWASNALFRGHEALINPSVLDTREGEVEALRHLTQQSATADKIASLVGNYKDAVSVGRGKTLERRARLSRSVFFSQATKRGLDQHKGSRA